MSRLIALCGTDAAGKATQSTLLAERISRMGHEAVIYSFPRYATEVGKALRRHLMGETMVAEFVDYPKGAVSVGSADYVQHQAHRRAPEDPLIFQCTMLADKMEASADIRAHLRAGRYVICDRWTPSAQAFGAADGLDRNWLRRVQEPLPEADLYLLLRVSEEETLRRRPVLRDRYEKDREKQKVVRGEYETLWREAASTGDKRWQVIDGEGPDAATVHARIWAEVVKVSVTA